jgi:hypothetical protein
MDLEKVEIQKYRQKIIMTHEFTHLTQHIHMHTHH